MSEAPDDEEPPIKEDEEGTEDSPGVGEKKRNMEEIEVVEASQDPLRFSSQDEGEPAICGFKDHFTLQIPSSTVRYRGRNAAAKIVEGNTAQFVLEETFDPETREHKVDIRRIHNTTEGVRFLRISYALVTAFWTGFLFVFCLQVLLFLILDLAIESGATSKGEANWGNATGVILSLLPFVHGLASALVIAGSFISDTVNGHTLIRNFAVRHIHPTTLEWLFFAFFLGLPLFVMCISLLSGSDEWWAVTLLFWLACVFVFFCFFCVNVIFYEIRACWEVIRHRYDDDDDSILHVLYRCVLLRQVSKYSGRKIISYLSYGAITDAENTDNEASRKNIIPDSYSEDISWRSKLTLWKKLEEWGWYENLEGKEERFFSLDDTRDVRPYVTTHTWSLEKIFCRRKNSRYIAIVEGPGAITKEQMRSSLICSVLGSVLIIFMVFSFLFYLGLGAAGSSFLVAIGVFCYYPSFKSSYQTYKSGREVALARASNPENSERDLNGTPKTSKALYRVEEYFRICKPTVRFSWIMFGVETVMFFVYPFASLISVENYPLAILFLIVAGVSLLRHYVNAAVVLEETGHMNLVDGATEEEVWKSQSRLNEITGSITRGRSRGAWTAVLGAVCFVFFALFLGAIGAEVDTLATFDTPYTYTSDFYYAQEDSLRYPSCQLTSDLGASPLTSMADFAFLAGHAYRGTGNVSQTELDKYFVNVTIVDQEDTVKEWRGDLESAVSFKLVTFPDAGNFAYVLIRGTTNNWDMLTDAQLWSAAILLQGLRELLPVGAMWTPVMDELIWLLTKLESDSIDRVSFYRDTTAFVNFLKTKVPTEYAGLGVTGHSLGGGLSIITGAQTGIPAIALSGPNAMLSRQSFDPPVTAEELDDKTFNIIPARDVVPRIDDRAQNFQQIRCETDLTDVVGCHDSTRSLCEIMYTCGSGDRPVLCECVTLFNYPEPLPKDPNSNLTFAEACSTGTQ